MRGSHWRRGVATVAVAVAVIAATASSSTAGPPANPVQVTLACTGSGTYSYIENVVLFNKAGQPVSSPISLECGIANDPFPTPKGYAQSLLVDVTARAAGWGWAGTWFCANPAAPGGGGAISAFASSSPFPKGKNAGARCPAPLMSGGSDVYLQFG